MSEVIYDYLNFPVQMLSGFMNDSNRVLNNIALYVVYKNTIKLIEGTGVQKMKTSAGSYGFGFNNYSVSFEDGKKIYDSTLQNSPLTGISRSMLLDYLNNEKNDFDKICLLAFLGIKSILGNKSYSKTTNLYLWSRMDGSTHTVVDVGQLSKEVFKYANRYQTEKIMTELRLNWSLIYYSRRTRGFYISFKMNLEDLIYEAENRRKSTKEKQLKLIQEEALKRALERLK